MNVLISPPKKVNPNAFLLLCHPVGLNIPVLLQPVQDLSIYSKSKNMRNKKVSLVLQCRHKLSKEVGLIKVTLHLPHAVQDY